MNINKFNWILYQKQTSKQQIANLLGIKLNSLQKKLSGKSTFNHIQINKILTALNVKYEDIFI